MIKILEEKTYLKFGYYSSILSRGSRKMVIVKCEQCDNEREVKFSASSNPCVQCKRSARWKKYEGRFFGEIEVLKYIGISEGDRHTIYECKCQCGTIFRTQLKRLKSGATKTCGCSRVKHMKELGESRAVGTISESAMNRCFYSYKRTAMLRELDWDLTKGQFLELTSMDCYYCGRKPCQVMKSKSRRGIFIYNGIDRRDNECGYIYSNCVPCCKICNYAKSNLSFDNFMLLIKKIYNKFYKNGTLQGS